MKCALFLIVAGLAMAGDEGSLPVTADERALGVREVAMLGVWRIRSGECTEAGALTVGGERWKPFAFASQTVTVDGQAFTLGIRQAGVMEGGGLPATGTGYAADRDKPLPASPVASVVYLLGPRLLMPGSEVMLTYSLGEGWKREKARVREDGTIAARCLVHGAARAVWVKFGEREVEFNLADWPAVSDRVKALAFPLPEKPEPPKRAALPR